MLAADDLGHRALVLGQFDIWLGGGAFFTVGQGLGAGLDNGLLKDFRHNRRTIHLFEMTFRHLARTEALDADLVLDIFEFFVHAGIEFASGDHNFQLALQAF